jgi:FKBP-type peptidyl-prolyl cis-trans isomerase
MKRKLAIALCAALALALALPVAAQASKADVSYALGMLIGDSAKSTNIDVDVAALISGVKDSMSGAKTKYTEAQANSMVQAALKAIADKKGADNLKAGLAFLDANKKKAGVKTTASGLQYEVIKEGSAQKPKATDTVTVHYEGKLISGKVFDSSIARGQPATFALNGVIKGWTEGLQLMGVGAKYRFYIPSGLGYGTSGAGEDIGPNEVLVFEVELISIGAPKK